MGRSNPQTCTQTPVLPPASRPITRRAPPYHTHNHRRPSDKSKTPHAHIPPSTLASAPHRMRNRERGSPRQHSRQSARGWDRNGLAWQLRWTLIRPDWDCMSRPAERWDVRLRNGATGDEGRGGCDGRVSSRSNRCDPAVTTPVQRPNSPGPFISRPRHVKQSYMEHYGWVSELTPRDGSVSRLDTRPPTSHASSRQGAERCDASDVL